MVCVSSSGVQGASFYQNKQKTGTKKECEEYWSSLLGLLTHRSLSMFFSHSLCPLFFWGWGASVAALSVLCVANLYALRSHSVLTQTPISLPPPLPVIALCCYLMTKPFNTSPVRVKLYGQIVKLKAQFCHKLSFSTAGQ